ncbi:MAG: hypothetical protein K2J01_00145 [Clostridiales bacterium]|nr:hypothetical protein [Clostridiales bacterium]
MFDYNTELAIKELFLLQYILGDAIDTHDAFDLFCEIYCVDESEQSEIVTLLDSRELNNIHTLSDYYREARLRQYFRNFRGGYVVEDERIEELVAIKGAVFEKAQADKLVCAYEKSCGRAYDELVRLAAEGNVSAKRVLGILQMEGMYITQDNHAGRDNLRDAADWLDTQSLATAIYYDENNRHEYLDKLYTVTQKTDYAAVVEQLQIQYGIENCKASESAKILEKAFIIGTAKREICSAQHLRVLRSNVLSEKDKRAVLLSGNKELIPAACALPLQLDHKKIPIKAGVAAPLDRAEESATVISMLDNNDLRDRGFFRCPCICSNSEYIRNAYADYIADIFADSNVVQIEVSSLLPIDLDATENNVFVRSCQEKQGNVYIIKLSGKIDERIVGLVKSFAPSSGRKTFAVSRLGISVDLTAVLPVFVCDGKNAQLLEDSVGIVKAADVTDCEKQSVLDDILGKKQQAFSTGVITVDDAAKSILLDLPICKMDGVLDSAVLSRRTDGEPICLTADIVKKFIGDKKTGETFGFGGTHAKK